MAPDARQRSSVIDAPNLGVVGQGEVARSSGLRRGLTIVWNCFLGMVFCQSFFTSILVVGWSYRWAQRAAVKEWWQRAEGSARIASFEQWARADMMTLALAQRPNWIMRERDGSGEPLSRRRFKISVASLWLNFKLGWYGILNTWVATLPGCVLWLFAWYDGWNNSFNKGYEQAVVGPLTGIAGVTLFIAAMLYLPLAQARQAVTGEWRSFFEFRLVWRAVRAGWLGAIGLAAAYAGLSLPVMFLKTLPAFLPQSNPIYESLSAAQAEGFLKGYFFWCALLVFPAYLWLRLRAARIYARGMSAALQSGQIEIGDLAGIERRALERLNMARPVVRTAARASLLKRSGARLKAGFAVAILAVLWFIFVAQIFVAEFFNYHPVIGWLNQPLVQLPWFRYLP